MSLASGIQHDNIPTRDGYGENVETHKYKTPSIIETPVETFTLHNIQIIEEVNEEDFTEIVYPIPVRDSGSTSPESNS